MDFLTSITDTWAFWIIMPLVLVGLIGIFLYLRNKKPED
jgi:hypothetical protein